MPRTRRVDCSKPGLARRARGRGFEYLDEHGRPIRAQQGLARIRALAIPPAWTEVWICADPNGHIQATGIDAANRKQYRYHDDWRTRRDQEKFDSMLDFAAAIPRLRRRIATDLAGDGPTRERVLACAARLLDLGFFRVGGEAYAAEKESYGLATMRKRHVTIDDGRVVFDYKAKGAKRRIQSIADDQVRELLVMLKRRRGGGEELLAYKAAGRWRDVTSTDINDYLKEASGHVCSAKDFRTWNATVLMAFLLAVLGEHARSSAGRARIVRAALDEVARHLGNTRAVCRASYVDPRVIDRFESGETIAPALARIRHTIDLADEGDRRRVERAVLRLLAV